MLGKRECGVCVRPCSLCVRKSAVCMCCALYKKSVKIVSVKTYVERMTTSTRKQKYEEVDVSEVMVCNSATVHGVLERYHQ